MTTAPADLHKALRLAKDARDMLERWAERVDDAAAHRWDLAGQLISPDVRYRALAGIGRVDPGTWEHDYDGDFDDDE